MKAATALRWTGALWFLPCLFALTCLYGAGNLDRSGYPTGDLASVGYALYVVGPVTAGFVALRFRRFPRLVGPLRPRRAGVPAILLAWWPLLLGPPATYCVAAVTTIRSVPLEASAWTVLLVDFLTVLACALVGLGLTWALPAVIAAPTATVGTFFWIAYTPSTGSELLHNLTSTFAACCTSGAVPADVAVHGTVTVTGVACLGMVLLLTARDWARTARRAALPAVAALLAASFGAGAAVALSSHQPLTLQAVQRRTTDLRCTSQDMVRVCLWPENLNRADDLVGALAPLNRALAFLGLDPISALTQDGRDPSAVSVEADSSLTDDGLRYTLYAGYIDRESECVGLFGRAFDDRVALLALATGTEPSRLPADLAPEAWATARSQWDRAHTRPEDVARWFRNGLRNLRCPRSA